MASGVVVSMLRGDSAEAKRLAEILRRLGHTPVLHKRAEACASLEGADFVLLVAREPDRPGACWLQGTARAPGRPRIPVVLISDRADAPPSARLPDGSYFAATLRTAAPDASVGQAVETALASRHEEARAALREDRFRRDEIIRRLMAQGPDRLACHVYRRHTADRRGAGNLGAAAVLSWAEIAEWAKLEGLLDEREARLLAWNPADSAAPIDGP